MGAADGANIGASGRVSPSAWLAGATQNDQKAGRGLLAASLKPHSGIGQALPLTPATDWRCSVAVMSRPEEQGCPLGIFMDKFRWPSLNWHGQLQNCRPLSSTFRIFDEIEGST